MGEAVGRVEAAAPSCRPWPRPAAELACRSALGRAAGHVVRAPGLGGRRGGGGHVVGQKVPPGHAASLLWAGLARDWRPRRAQCSL